MVSHNSTSNDSHSAVQTRDQTSSLPSVGNPSHNQNVDSSNNEWRGRQAQGFSCAVAVTLENLRKNGTNDEIGNVFNGYRFGTYDWKEIGKCVTL